MSQKGRNASREPQQPAVGKHQKKRLPAWAVTATLVIVLLVAACGFGVYMFAGYHDIYPGVRSCGVTLSGMTERQAADALAEPLAALGAGNGLTVTVLGVQYAVTPEESGIVYDAAATAVQAMAVGRTGGIAERLHAIFAAFVRGADIPAVMTVDETNLRVRIAEIAEAVSGSVVQPTWHVDSGKLVIDRGAPGYAIKEETLLTLLRGRYETGDYSEVVFSPDVTAQDPVDPDRIADEISREKIEPSLDLEKDPTGETIVPGQIGVEVDRAQLRQALTGDWQSVSVPLTYKEPQYSNAEYKSMLFRDLLGRGKSSFDSANVGRTTNVLLATEACNGVILMPGDTFSYNDSVGPRTYERGFKDAIVYVGTSAEAGVGGGICQVSSTIYYAVLRADLEIVERYAHSRTVTYVPLGEDATVAWGSKDFKFKNNTPFPLKVVTTHTKSSLTIELYGTQLVSGKEIRMDTTVLSHNPFEIKHETDTTLPLGTTKVKSNGYSGYVTETYRVVYINGEEVSRTFENKSTYTRYDKVILENPVPVVNPEPMPDPVPPTEPVTPTEPGTETPPAGTSEVPVPVV